MDLINDIINNTDHWIHFSVIKSLYKKLDVKIIVDDTTGTTNILDLRNFFNYMNKDIVTNLMYKNKNKIIISSCLNNLINKYRQEIVDIIDEHLFSSTILFLIYPIYMYDNNVSYMVPDFNNFEELASFIDLLMLSESILLKKKNLRYIFNDIIYQQSNKALDSNNIYHINDIPCIRRDAKSTIIKNVLENKPTPNVSETEKDIILKEHKYEDDLFDSIINCSVSKIDYLSFKDAKQFIKNPNINLLNLNKKLLNSLLLIITNTHESFFMFNKNTYYLNMRKTLNNVNKLAEKISIPNYNKRNINEIDIDY